MKAQLASLQKDKV